MTMSEQPSSEEMQARFELLIAFNRAIGLGPNKVATPRQKRVMCYSDETKRIIIRAIELDPALEEAILKLAECAYQDGYDDSQHDGVV